MSTKRQRRTAEWHVRRLHQAIQQDVEAFKGEFKFKEMIKRGHIIPIEDNGGES